MGGKAILYFEIVTTLALFVGLLAVNLVQPGAGVQLSKGATADLAQSSAGFSQIVEHTFPTSIIDSMARGEVLQIVVFSFLFGAACVAIGAKAIWFQLRLINLEAAALAARGGLSVVLDRCVKMEHGRYSGRLHWGGMNTEIISARKALR